MLTVSLQTNFVFFFRLTPSADYYILIASRFLQKKKKIGLYPEYNENHIKDLPPGTVIAAYPLHIHWAIIIIIILLFKDLHCIDVLCLAFFDRYQ